MHACIQNSNKFSLAYPLIRTKYELDFTRRYGKNRRKTLISNMNKQNAPKVESLNSDKLSINQLAVLFCFKIKLTWY